MEKYELEEIDTAFGTLSKFLCVNFKRMDTDAAVALTRALEELLHVRAILARSYTKVA